MPTPHDHGEIQLFKKFQKIADGGPWRKTEKFWQIEQKIGDLYELDNFKQKFFLKKKFQNWDSKCHFRTILNKSEIFFWSIAQIESSFQKLGHWVIKTVCLKMFNSSRWPRKFMLTVG